MNKAQRQRIQCRHPLACLNGFGNAAHGKEGAAQRRPHDRPHIPSLSELDGPRKDRRSDLDDLSVISPVEQSLKQRCPCQHLDPADGGLPRTRNHVPMGVDAGTVRCHTHARRDDQCLDPVLLVIETLRQILQFAAQASGAIELAPQYQCAGELSQSVRAQPCGIARMIKCAFKIGDLAWDERMLAHHRALQKKRRQLLAVGGGIQFGEGAFDKGQSLFRLRRPAGGIGSEFQHLAMIRADQFDRIINLGPPCQRELQHLHLVCIGKPGSGFRSGMPGPFQAFFRLAGAVPMTCERNGMPNPVAWHTKRSNQWEDSVQTSQRVIRSSGLEIATEAFGDPAHPPVVLIMGGMASMLWWRESFCLRLAEQGRFVIRYDQRDTGLSTKYPPSRPGYTFDDAVDDVFRVLDGYGISTVHLVGFSLGGMVGQVAALKHPERVLSLTAISTSPVGVDNSHFPPSGEAWMEHMSVEADWSDRTDAVAYLVDDTRLTAGMTHPFDEAGTRAFIERDFDRSGGYLSATNHSVLFEIGETWQGRLNEMKVSLLVIHGTADPVFPLAHGEALARAVTGAGFVKVEGGGHEIHPDDWEAIISAIDEHVRRQTSVK